MSSGVATPIAASSALTWSSIRLGTGRAAPALSRQVIGFLRLMRLIEPSSTMPAASATRSASTRLNASSDSARVGRSSIPSVSPPRKPQPKMSCLRSQVASASCDCRSYIPGVWRLRAVSSPSHNMRACIARTTRSRACPRSMRSTRPRSFGSARSASSALSRGTAAAAPPSGPPSAALRRDRLVDPGGVLQRLLVLAARAIAIQVDDVARPLLQPLAIDRVDAGLARGRRVRLHARRQHRQRRRDAEHLQEIVLAGPRPRRRPRPADRWRARRTSRGTRSASRPRPRRPAG